MQILSLQHCLSSSSLLAKVPQEPKIEPWRPNGTRHPASNPWPRQGMAEVPKQLSWTMPSLTSRRLNKHFTKPYRYVVSIKTLSCSLANNFFFHFKTKGEFDKPLWLLKNIKKDRKCATNKKLSTKEQVSPHRIPQHTNYWLCRFFQLKCQFRVLQKFGIWIDKIEEQKVINVEPAVLDQRLSNYTKAKESLRKVMCEVHEELNKDTRTPKVKNYKFPNEVDRTTMKTLDFKFFKELVNTLTKIQRMSSQRWRKKRDKLKNKN